MDITCNPFPFNKVTAIRWQGKSLHPMMYASCLYRRSFLIGKFPQPHHSHTSELLLRSIKKMALLGCGWGLGRSLLSLAGVGFVFHLGRKVQHLEGMVLKLEDEKEKLSDLHTEAVQGVESMKEMLYVAEIEKAEFLVLHQEASKELLSVQLQNLQVESQKKELGREVECMQQKLARAEMQIAQHAVLEEESVKDLMSQKQELESSLHSALEKLKEREQELLASGAQKRRLELSLDSAVEKMRKTEGEFHALFSQKTQLRERLKVIQQSFEAYRKEVRIYMAMSSEKVQHGKKTEASNLSLESVADVNIQLLKQVKELQSQSKDGGIDTDAQTCELQNHDELPVMLVPTTAASLRDFAQAPGHGSFDVRPRNEGDEKSLPNSERSNKGKEKATDSSSPTNEVEKSLSDISNGRRKLAFNTSYLGRATK